MFFKFFNRVTLSFILLFYFCLFSAAVSAEKQQTDSQRIRTNPILNKFYERTQSMQADFVQIITNSKGKLVEQSNGTLIFSRPDKFILDYISPVEQKYISNGKTLWIYDVELEQVNIKSLDEGMGDSPALLLSSNTNIYKFYNVTDVLVSSKQSQSENYQWVQLVSKQTDTTFERVLLAFKDHELMGMKMFDSFGQLTELKFSNTQLNKPFASRQFNFTPPDGVDVIGSVNGQ